MPHSASTASAERNASADAAVTPRSSPSPARLYAALVGVAAAVVAVDQLTKWVAVSQLGAGRVVEVLGGFVHLRLTYNSGGAFGIGRAWPGLFLVATIGIVTILLFSARRLTGVGAAAAFGLVIGGGVGNALDRVLREPGGRVVDFIDLGWWPVFNVADSAIVVGVVLVLLFTWRRPHGA